VQNGTLWKLGLDDSFRFSCKQCGRCCINNTIIVNTYDIIRMRHTLKMTTCEMMVNNLLSFNVGPNSGMPIATIRFRRINDVCVCPFLAPVYQAKSLDDLKKRIQNGKIDTKGLISAKNCDGEDVFLCSIHPDKPLRCRAYPLGRIFEHNDSVIDIANARSSWFHVDLPDHCNVSNAKQHTVHEWIESQGLKDYIETSNRCTSMLERIARANVLNNEDVSALAFMVLYNFDSIVKNDTGMSDKEMLGFVEKSVDMFIEIAAEGKYVLSQN